MSTIKWTRHLRTPLSTNSPIIKYFTPSKPSPANHTPFLKPKYDSYLSTASAEAFRHREHFKKYRFYQRSPSTPLYKRCQSIKKRLIFDEDSDTLDQANLNCISTAQEVLKAETVCHQSYRTLPTIPKITISHPGLCHTPYIRNKDLTPRKSVVNISPNTQSIFNILSHLKNHEILGRGKIGVVVKAELKGEKLALKIVVNKGFTPLTFGEQHIINLCHPNIVEFKSNIIIKRKLSIDYYIIYMQYHQQARTLKNILEAETCPLQPRVILRYTADICCALAYLHNNLILHLDVNPKSILVCLDGTSKLYDFTTAVHTNDQKQSNFQFFGAVRYKAPEIIIRSKPLPASDIYSFAITMWQLLYRTTPYGKAIQEDYLMYAVVEDGLRPKSTNYFDNNQFYELYKNIYCKCWNDNPKIRFNALDIFENLNALKKFV